MKMVTKHDFTNIIYLKNGNARQQAAFKVLTHYRILELLAGFNPVLVGTIPISIDIEGSDLDIICHVTDFTLFLKTLNQSFSPFNNYTLNTTKAQEKQAVVANFTIDGFDVEVFGQAIPVKEQYAYRHMIIENTLLNKLGEDFKNQIIKLKQNGYKTEPAFGKALGLRGNAYTELLKYENR